MQSLIAARRRTAPAAGLPGAWEGIRTPDLRITSALLYRLSYPGDATDQATRDDARDSLPGDARKAHEQGLEHERFVGVADELDGRLFDCRDRGGQLAQAEVASGRATGHGAGARHQAVAVGGRQRRQPGTELVGPPPPLLALVAILDSPSARDSARAHLLRRAGHGLELETMAFA